MKAKRAVVAGVVGTAAMTVLMLGAPKLGLAKLAIGQQLSTFLAVSVGYLPVGPFTGWIVHFGFGIVLAIIYALVFQERLTGPPVLRGALYGVLVFILAQLVFMPLMGAGVFSRGDVPMLVGSLIMHLVYGGVDGAICGEPARARPAA